MTGQQYKSEKETFKDQKTGNEITKLTNGDSHNFHFYFTDNSFVTGDKEIIFLSDRGSQKEFAYNFFKMDLHTGEMVQLSDESRIEPGTYTKTPEGDIIAYVSGRTIKKLDTKTLKTEVIYETVEDVELRGLSISCDRNYIGFLKNENVGISNAQPNYAGFLDKMFAIKRSTVTLAALDGTKAFDVFQNTHWTTHFQFSPIEPAIATFCHEGPWNLVHQRIWIIDFVTRQVTPCIRQQQDDCIGHEFWTRNGLIFFDNRRKGHDGTITVNKTQAFVTETPALQNIQTPYVGFADSRGRLIKTYDMPFYCNHYHGNPTNTILVGDGVEDLSLISLKKEKPELKTLCYHGTSWYTQTTHCHPTFDWKGENILYTSDLGGKHNLYLVNGSHMFE